VKKKVSSTSFTPDEEDAHSQRGDARRKTRDAGLKLVVGN